MQCENEFDIKSEQILSDRTSNCRPPDILSIGQLDVSVTGHGTQLGSRLEGFLSKCHYGSFVVE